MLRQDTAACLSQALTIARELVTDGNDVAAVAVTGKEPRSLFVGHDYWRVNGADFEQQVADDALQHENCGALVVPLLYVADPEGPSFRDPRNAMQAGETHMLFCLTWHEREGFDVHRVFYTRRPNGAPVFDAVESYDGAVQLPATAPGAVLIRSAIQHGGSSS